MLYNYLNVLFNFIIVIIPGDEYNYDEEDNEQHRYYYYDDLLSFFALFVEDTEMTLVHEDDSMTEYSIENEKLTYRYFEIEDYEDIEYDSDDENHKGKKCEDCGDNIIYEGLTTCFYCTDIEYKGTWGKCKEVKRDVKYDHLIYYNNRKVFLNFLINSLMITDYTLSEDEKIIRNNKIKELYNNNNSNVLNAVHNNYRNICIYI